MKFNCVSQAHCSRLTAIEQFAGENIELAAEWDRLTMLNIWSDKFICFFGKVVKQDYAN